MAISTKPQKAVELCVLKRGCLVVHPVDGPMHLEAGVALKTREHIEQRDANKLVLHDIAEDYTGRKLPKGTVFPGGKGADAPPAPATPPAGETTGGDG